MKRLLQATLLLTAFTTGCVSWVFAKSPFNELPSGTYQLDLTHASLVWRVSHLGLSNYTARFADFDASIDYNSDNIEKSRVTARINPMSIQTAYPHADEKDFDKVLATEKGWFNALEFPDIRFASTAITMTGDNSADMQGDLTLLGVTKPVTLKVVFNGAMLRQPFSGKPTMGFSATARLNRSEWGMSKYVPSIGDSVEILIEGEFAKTEAP